MLLRQIFDPHLAQYAYLVGCQKTGEAILIDPERDVDRYLKLAEEENLHIVAVAETHIHADFVSGAQELAAADRSLKIYLSGEGEKDWQSKWALEHPGLVRLRDGDQFSIGKIEFTVVHTPGHTPEHLSYLVTDVGGGADEPMVAFTGDFLFVGDVGRPDLLEQAMGVSGTQERGAKQLFESLIKFAAFSEHLQILPAHGAGSACGKALGAVPFSTLGYERKFNAAFQIALKKGEKEFVSFILKGQPEPPLYFSRMKEVNRDGAVIMGQVHPPKKFSIEEARVWKGKILDTRSDRKSFAEGHLLNAIYAPIPGPFFSTSAGSYLSPEEEVLLVVESESVVEKATRQLYRIGLDHVKGWILVEELAQAGLLQTRIDRVEFDHWVRMPKDLVLDVRNAAEFALGHLDEALNIAYTRLKARLREVPRDQKLFIHCGSGKRAALAASYLQAEGFEVVHVDGICEACESIAQSSGVYLI